MMKVKGNQYFGGNNLGMEFGNLLNNSYMHF